MDNPKDDPYAAAFEKEDPYAGAFSTEIPKPENFLQKIIKNSSLSGPSSLGSSLGSKVDPKVTRGVTEGFGDVASFGGSVLARKGADALVDRFMPEDQSKKSQLYHQLTDTDPTAKMIGGGLASGLGLSAGLAHLGKGAVNLARSTSPEKAMEIGKNFFPFVRKGQAEFGREFRGGVREARRSGALDTGIQKAQKVISDLANNDETISQLPSKLQTQIQEVATNPKPTLKDLIRLQNKMKQAVKQSGYMGQAGEHIRELKETSRNLGEIAKSSSPRLKAASEKFQPFAQSRETMSRLFQPAKAKTGVMGTTRATKSLKRIPKMEPGEQEAIKYFEKATGTNILGPVKAKDFLGKAGFVTGAGGIGLGILDLIRRSLPK